jgi:hypothetical protein
MPVRGRDPGHGTHRGTATRPESQIGADIDQNLIAHTGNPAVGIDRDLGIESLFARMA